MAQGRGSNEKSSDRQQDRQQSTRGEQGGESSRGGMTAERNQGERSQQQGSEQGGGKRRSEAANLTVSAMRSLGQLFDMQAASARMMLRAQIRAASAFGLPDYSRMFEIGDDRATRLFSNTTENLVQFAGQRDEVLNEIPAQVFRLFEKQAIDVTERMKVGLKELQQQATDSIEEFKEFSRRQADEIAQATEMLTEATEATLRESGEQFRSSARQEREAMERETQEAGKEGEEAQEGAEQGSRARRAA